MNRSTRSPLARWLPLLLGAPALALAAPRVGAQGCPTQIVTVNRPANNSSNLCGTVRVDITLSTPPAGWTQQSVTCQIQDLVGGIYEQGLCYQINPTTYAYLADTTLIKNAFYKVIVLTSLYNPTTMQTCPQQNAVVPQFNVVNPGAVRQVSLVKQRGGFTRNPVRTASNTDPATGDQNFTVPITSWDYKGATIPFFLEYDSVGMTDPQQPVEPNFSGLSERNSHWTHPFAQWIDLAADPTNSGAPISAVWHHGNTTLYFINGPNNTWGSPDSHHSLAGDGVMASQTVTCDNTGMQMSDPDPVPNSSFTLTDGDNTKYSFGGGSNIYWEVVGCMALPHYLLTKITDRWGRSLTITWGPVQGTTEPRVTGVADDTGTGVTLLYTNGLISSIKDPQNRTHTLKYTEVPSEIGTSFNKLTSVQAFGPGDVTRVTYNWSFSYQDPNDPQNLADERQLKIPAGDN